jgi:hypothetical protein
MSGYVGLSQPKNRKREAIGLNGVVQAWQAENDDPAVGPDVPIASYSVKKFNSVIVTGRHRCF